MKFFEKCLRVYFCTISYEKSLMKAAATTSSIPESSVPVVLLVLTAAEERGELLTSDDEKSIRLARSLEDVDERRLFSDVLLTLDVDCRRLPLEFC